MNEMNELKSTITITDLVAFWGAITGTVSLIIAFFTFNRDRAKIELGIKRNWKVVNSPNYNQDDYYLVITIYNKGRRTATITNVGFVYLKREGGVILSDSVIFGSRELAEGKSTDYLIEEKKMDDFPDIEYFVAYDAIGNGYKKYVSPFYKRFFYKTLYFFHPKSKLPLRTK